MSTGRVAAVVLLVAYTPDATSFTFTQIQSCFMQISPCRRHEPMTRPPVQSSVTCHACRRGGEAIKKAVEGFLSQPGPQPKLEVHFGPPAEPCGPYMADKMGRARKTEREERFIHLQRRRFGATTRTLDYVGRSERRIYFRPLKQKLSSSRAGHPHLRARAARCKDDTHNQ